MTEHLVAPFVFASARLQPAGAPFVARAPRPSTVARPVSKPRSVRKTRIDRLRDVAIHPLTTGALVFGVLGVVFAYGAVRGGAYDRFIHEVGTPGDLLARAFGFGIDTVTISGIGELKETEILAYAGIKARNSLPYLDAKAMRERLLMVPLIKDAEVRKLYPNRLAITIVERQPYALWQKDGKIAIVSADGMPIDTMHDDKYVNLPLIVGPDANLRLDQYRRIIEAAGELAPRIKAGTLVAKRRWSLFTKDGIEIRLPERDPEAAVAELARLQGAHRILDKDIVALDLRAPGRIEIQLSNEAASARLERISRKAKGKV